MFLSLKWKAVAFLSLVIGIVTGAWLAQHIHTTTRSYENRMEAMHTRQQLILNQLLDDNFSRLSQLAQLVAEMPRIKRAVEPNGSANLEKSLEDEWIEVNIKTGIDYIGLFSTGGELLGSAFNQTLFHDQKSLLESIYKASQNSSTRAPKSFIYCKFGCTQFVMEPVVSSNGSEALMITGQNIADIIQRYQQVSHSDLAVLLSHSSDSDFALNSDRSLTSWGNRLWAASRFEETFTQLRQIQNSLPFSHIDSHHSINVESKQLVLHRLKLIGYQSFGLSPGLVAISDETQGYKNLVNSLKSSIGIGLLVFLASALILFFLMLAPLRRLFSVVEALNLLPKHRYQEAHCKIQGTKAYLPDELSLLEKSTRFVTNELETLHKAVEEKNTSLQGQIAVISRSRAFLERLINNAQMFIVTQKLDGTLLTKNAHFERNFQRPISNFADLFISQESREAYFKKIESLNSSVCNVFQFEAEFANDQGVAVYFDWTCSPVEDEQGQSIILAIGVDLTKRKQDERALEWLASNDPLTGIGNRRAFQHDLGKMLASESGGAVIFIDVNRFKQINDLYGHTAGDRVLVQIADSLRETVRSSDAISRLAGDEFTVILPNIKLRQLEQFLQKLSQKLNGQIQLQDQLRSIEYNVSIGAALNPEHGNSEQELIAHADMAMYQAKKRGGNQWEIFNPANNDLADLRRDHDLISLLKQALKADNLFELFFQPIYSIEQKTVSHYEVLLRLTDTSGETVYPGDFIPAAERMGLIRLVDEWVLDQAIHRLASGRNAGYEFSLSINISAPTLQSDTFPDVLIRLIKKYSVDPGQIIIELTETAYIENFQMVLTNLQRISKAGTLVALDDFGVGFSSFNYLKKLPLNYVKLDGSYILDLEKSPDNQVFVESLNKMVKAFGMRTVAEFVEDAATLAKLEELGITYAQGYYIGKPSPDLEAMISEPRAGSASMRLSNSSTATQK